MPTRIVLDTTPAPSQITAQRSDASAAAAARRAVLMDETDPSMLSSPSDEKHLYHNNNHPPPDVLGPSWNSPPPDGRFLTRSLMAGPTKRSMAAQSRAAAAAGNDSTNGGLMTPVGWMPATSSFRSNKNSNGNPISFRSSILRELAVRVPVKEEIRLSSDDIRASPRFVGYLFCMISGSVLLVSVIQFYNKEIDKTRVISSDDVNPDIYYVTTNGDLVFRWKLWGAIYLSAGGVGLCILIILAHFDTLLLPKVWIPFFRDGSLAERNLILGLVLFWMGGLHICTSSLSVGESQANVFFTSWIAFGSMTMNYGVWRESAGLPTLIDKVSLHHRGTTYNWIWTFIFSTIFAGSATDIYYNRDVVELRYEGEILNLERDSWIVVLAVVWAEVALCVLAVFFNEYFVGSYRIPILPTAGVVYQPNQPAAAAGDGTTTNSHGTPSVLQQAQPTKTRCVLVFGWRQIEGVLMLGACAAKFWVILTYSGVDGIIRGLSNAYFGIWGTFFNSVFALGSWLNENRNIEYVVRETRY